MKKYVFRLGSAQLTTNNLVLATAVVVGLVAHIVCGLSGPASIGIRNGLALFSTAVVLQVPLQVFESGGDIWDFNRHRRSTGRSAYLLMNVIRLFLVYICHQIGKNYVAAKCNACHRVSTLATRLDCKISFCESAGHLLEHIRTHPSHRKYYSFKLNRLVKCCKSSCKVTDIKDLLACHF
ncbi:hypothetical protein Hanom_Chr10g00881761 [Helianthus anomalus]